MIIRKNIARMEEYLLSIKGTANINVFKLKLRKATNIYFQRSTTSYSLNLQFQRETINWNLIKKKNYRNKFAYTMRGSCFSYLDHQNRKITIKQGSYWAWCWTSHGFSPRALGTGGRKLRQLAGIFFYQFLQKLCFEDPISVWCNFLIWLYSYKRSYL